MMLKCMSLCVFLFSRRALTNKIFRLKEHNTTVTTVFMALDFHGLALGGLTMGSVISLVALVLSLTLVDIFDTAGLLIVTYSKTTDPDDPDYDKGMQHIMIADALATTLGSFFGASTVTSYAESTAGIAAGGKTGLTSLTTAICFTLATLLTVVFVLYFLFLY